MIGTSRHSGQRRADMVNSLAVREIECLIKEGFLRLREPEGKWSVGSAYVFSRNDWRQLTADAENEHPFRMGYLI